MEIISPVFSAAVKALLVCLSLFLQHAEVLPATHFVRLIRAVVLRGATLGEMVNDSIFLVGFTLAGLTVASLKFRKRLD